MVHEIAALEASTAAVLVALRGCVGDEPVRRPSDGGWNAREIAYHLLDIERWYAAKLCEAVALDQSAALDRFMDVWSRLRAETLALARAVPSDRLDRRGLLSGVPAWTPRDLLAAMAAHDREHAAQALAARRSGEGA
jgi:hypothetical protein